MDTKVTTLCVTYRDGQVLLGMKKRGFGRGKWNGFGGKVQPGESIIEAASRECTEEAGITPVRLEERGVLLFHFPDNPTVHEVHIFFISTFTGKPAESEEMRPQWFALDAIPYDKMWADDKFWLPEVLAGKSIHGTFWFTERATVREHTLKVA